nr:MAG TPA: hypothetical protein [Bacteriophage sp.]
MIVILSPPRLPLVPALMLTLHMLSKFDSNESLLTIQLLL